MNQSVDALPKYTEKLRNEFSRTGLKVKGHNQFCDRSRLHPDRAQELLNGAEPSDDEHRCIVRAFPHMKAYQPLRLEFVQRRPVAPVPIRSGVPNLALMVSVPEAKTSLSLGDLEVQHSDIAPLRTFKALVLQLRACGVPDSELYACAADAVPFCPHIAELLSKQTHIPQVTKRALSKEQVTFVAQQLKRMLAEAIAEIDAPVPASPILTTPADAATLVAPAATKRVEAAPALAAVPKPTIRPRSFAEHLRAHREAAGLQRGELGELVGLSGSAVQKWESRNTMPAAETLAKLLGLFPALAPYAPRKPQRGSSPAGRSVRGPEYEPPTPPAEQKRVLAGLVDPPAQTNNVKALIAFGVSLAAARAWTAETRATVAALLRSAVAAGLDVSAVADELTSA